MNLSDEYLDAFIKKYYCELPAALIARLFGCSDTRIRYIYKRLSLVVPPEVLTQFKNSVRIQPGHISKNKGKRLKDYATPETIAKFKLTQFKPGNCPPNFKPVGSEAIRNDGYIYLKLANPNKWQAKHRYLYEQARGKIPRGFKVRFKDGNRLNFDLTNLELISNRKLMLLNTIHNYPPEITKAVQLIGALNRQIKKRT